MSYQWSQYTYEKLGQLVSGGGHNGHNGSEGDSLLCTLGSPYSNGTLPAELFNCMYRSLESRSDHFSLINWAFIFLSGDGVGSFAIGWYVLSSLNVLCIFSS